MLRYTRAKYTSARSAEEKSWVALDMLAHPHQYAHVTEAEVRLVPRTSFTPFCIQITLFLDVTPSCLLRHQYAHVTEG